MGLKNRRSPKSVRRSGVSDDDISSISVSNLEFASSPTRRIVSSPAELSASLVGIIANPHQLLKVSISAAVDSIDCSFGSFSGGDLAAPDFCSKVDLRINRKRAAALVRASPLNLRSGKSLGVTTSAAPIVASATVVVLDGGSGQSALVTEVSLTNAAEAAAGQQVVPAVVAPAVADGCEQGAPVMEVSLDLDVSCDSVSSAPVSSVASPAAFDATNSSGVAPCSVAVSPAVATMVVPQAVSDSDIGSDLDLDVRGQAFVVVDVPCIEVAPAPVSFLASKLDDALIPPLVDNIASVPVLVLVLHLLFDLCGCIFSFVDV